MNVKKSSYQNNAIWKVLAGYVKTKHIPKWEEGGEIDDFAISPPYAYLGILKIAY